MTLVNESGVQQMTGISAKKRMLVLRGSKVGATMSSPQIDFAEYARSRGFERLVEDMQSGRNPVQRLHLTDTQGNGLRVIIRKTGMITYHCHYFAPEPPADMEYEEEEVGGGARPLLKIGSYPGTDVKTARHRAEVVSALARSGIDVRWGLQARLMKELDAKGLKWRP
jgi:Arm DNA-binding domain